ncbi:MAG: lysophospholipid acyltransferase family protein [Candidatus Cloacimonetes bacterium]|jgi:lysophospholipid acyltransferase (LPLAT)-like uncharacterized protein|nr:lysophospholipid acyltransferase family protein [Candidatus Cloacimonadota bacterium]
MNKFLLYLVKHLAFFIVRILGISWRYNLQTPAPKEKVIYAFWHRNMLPLLFLHRNQNVVILISSSKDGEIIAGPAKLLGYQTARGSSSKKGSSATRKLIKLAKENSIGITPDGPKGPSEIIKDGVTFLSYFTKLPIVPIAVDVNKETVFKSWDRFRLPHFFSKINVTYGDPIYINTKDEIEEKKEFLQSKFNELTKENTVR